jgi:hypothetical protein
MKKVELLEPSRKILRFLLALAGNDEMMCQQHHQISQIISQLAPVAAKIEFRG